MIADSFSPDATLAVFVRVVISASCTVLGHGIRYCTAVRRRLEYGISRGMSEQRDRLRLQVDLVLGRDGS